MTKYNFISYRLQHEAGFLFYLLFEAATTVRATKMSLKK